MSHHHHSVPNMRPVGDDLERQKKLARAARQSFTSQIRRLFAGVTKGNANNLLGLLCVLVTATLIFVVVLCPFVGCWHRGSGKNDCPYGSCVTIPPEGPGAQLSVSRDRFEENAVTVVVAVRTLHPPPSAFLSALMNIDQSANVEFIFVTNSYAPPTASASHHEGGKARKGGGGGGGGGGNTLQQALADRLVEVRHKHFSGSSDKKPHQGMVAPRIVSTKPPPPSSKTMMGAESGGGAGNNKKNNKKGSGGRVESIAVPLGQMYAVGADAARPESKYVLFLSSFSRVLEPRHFVANMLRDIKSQPTECDTWMTVEGASDSPLLFNNKSHHDHAAAAGGGGGSSGNSKLHALSSPSGTGPRQHRLSHKEAAQLAAKHNNNGAKTSSVCHYGAIQCMMLEPSVGSDIIRSSPYVIADAGWTVDIGSASTSDSAHFLDETVFLANREAGTPPNAGRYRKESTVPVPVDAIGPSCFIADRAALYDAGAFSLTRDTPTSVDAAIGGTKAPMVARRDAALSALFDSVVSVETIMDHMSMDEVRKATPSLRRQVRSSYSAVMEMILLYEEMSKTTMSAARSKPRPPGFPYIGADGSIDVEKRGSDNCIAAGTTEQKLVCSTDRMHVAGRIVHTMTDMFTQASISEYAVSWLPSLHMRVRHNRVGLSPGSHALYDFRDGSAESELEDDGAAGDSESVEEVAVVAVAKNDKNNNNKNKKADDDQQMDMQYQSILRRQRQERMQLRKSIESKLLIASAQISQTALLEGWTAPLRALHNAYRGFLHVHSPATGEILVPTVGPDNSAPASFVRVVWFAICCGCCGFSAEIAHFVRPLSEKYPISLIPGPRCFCPGMPSGFSDMIARQNIKLTQYVREELYPGESVVWIAHTDPRSFVQGGFFVRRKPNYLVGRTMYEATRIPVDWEPRLHDADELWVPCVFVQNMLLDAGLGIEAEKVFIIPEGIDTNFFAPAAHEPLRFVKDADFVSTNNISWEHVFCNRDSFWATPEQRAASRRFFDAGSHAARFANRTWSRMTEEELRQNRFYQSVNKKKQGGGKAPDPFEFFSNFKWEPRKGWEFLFESYFEDFYEKQDSEDVTLMLLSYVFYSHGTPKGWSVFNETYMVESLQGFLETRYPGRKMHEMPRFCIVAEAVTEFELAQLFRGADSFVLPTRGEGWGLPTMQAMSMGLPVISTNWGGSVDFTTQDTTFLIEIAGVEELPQDSPYGWREGKKWATPSVQHLRQLMRYVVDNREHALAVGRRARAHIVKNYDDFEVVKIVDKRLQEISRLLE